MTDISAPASSSTANPPKPKPTKKPPQVSQRVGRLDGKKKRRPSGRHAGKKPRKGDDPPPLSVSQRLGFRIPEWCALLGISLPSAYRAINAGQLETVTINGIRFIPRKFAIEAGLITADDAI
jgi:predicted DNA-binding transcriptional regulator AlpA